MVHQGLGFDSVTTCIHIGFNPVKTTSNDGEASEQLYAEMKPAVEGANYIVKHMRDKNDYSEVRDAATVN